MLINTLIMIVNERKREIGMMSALGLNSNEILSLFALEGVIIGTLGSAIGVVIGGVLTKSFSTAGLDLTQPWREYRQIYCLNRCFIQCSVWKI